ncbi:hypothetical protein ccbrp13_01320 [Ktedonobacteria bacterium brp13]|nr:hypothetical protein ccbrp13_01320 [Ktedonobacteria bacterium brp13]
MRGNLNEGEPYGLPGTYLNSVYELHPLLYAEAQYGSPESLVALRCGLRQDNQPGRLQAITLTLDFDKRHLINI